MHKYFRLLAAAALLLASTAAPARPIARGHDLRGPGAPRAAVQTSGLIYYGGPVISNPKVYVVWWGDPANLNPDITGGTTSIASFFEGVLDSPFIDAWAQYDTNIAAQAGSDVGDAGTNQLIGRGNYAGTYTLSSIPAGNVTDAQIQTALEAAITAGTLPPTDANTIYAIYFPASVTINLDAASPSCSTFGGYHDQSATLGAIYLAIPDCGYAFLDYCSVSSHELAEATTDVIPTPGSNPDYPQAWNDSQGNEAGDLCETTGGLVSTPLGSFGVQGIWDQRSKSCQITAHAAQDFSVAFSPHAWNLAIGGSATLSVQTALVAGAAQTLALAVQAPAGITASLAASTLQSGASTTLTLSASSAVQAAQVIVTATAGSGATALVHTASLLVDAAAVTSDFSLLLTPPEQQITAGSTATYMVQTVADGGSVPPISLSVIGLGSTIGATLAPAQVDAGTSSTLTLKTPRTLLGSYPFQIVARADLTHTISGTLTVTAPTDGGSPADGGAGDGGASDGGHSNTSSSSGGCSSAPIETLGLSLLAALWLASRTRRPQAR